MQCDDARALMMDRLDEGVADARLEQHLDVCQDCRAEWRALSRSEALLRSASLVEPPYGLAERVAAAIADETPESVKRPHPVAQLALAACGLLALASGALSILSGSPAFAPDEQWVVLADNVARSVALAGRAMVAQPGAQAAQWAFYAFAAAAMVVGWFGALVVPRHAAGSVVSRDWSADRGS